jgi:hypothetical protein
VTIAKARNYAQTNKKLIGTDAYWKFSEAQETKN